MLAALTPDMLATGGLCLTYSPFSADIVPSDLADYLVRKGVPFRETHHISGQVVALAEDRNMPMDNLTHEDLQSVDKRLGSDFIFDHEKSVEMRTASGGTVSSLHCASTVLGVGADVSMQSRFSVQEQITVLKMILTGQTHNLSS